MGSHPLNLVLRFLLEISALLALGLWGWRQREDALRFILALAIPLIIAAVWGIFAVPNDPSRSGSAPIAVPGLLRLAIELAVFALAVWALYDVNFAKTGLILGIAVSLHYFVSYDRILWLVAR